MRGAGSAVEERRKSRCRCLASRLASLPQENAGAISASRSKSCSRPAGCNADLHPAFAPLLAPDPYLALAGEAHRDALQAVAARARLQDLFRLAERQLQDNRWITGFRSLADAYLYIMLRWADQHRLDLAAMPNLGAFKLRMEPDPGVQAALAAEGLH